MEDISKCESCSVIGVTCRGICERYRAEYKRYGSGVKRCTYCDIYLKYDGTQCPCCRIQLRGKRKSKRIHKKINVLPL